MNSKAYTPESLENASKSACQAFSLQNTTSENWAAIVRVVAETLQLAPPTNKESDNADTRTIRGLTVLNEFIEGRNRLTPPPDPEREAIKRALWGVVTFPRGDADGEKLADRIQEELRKVKR